MMLFVLRFPLGNCIGRFPKPICKSSLMPDIRFREKGITAALVDATDNFRDKEIENN